MNLLSVRDLRVEFDGGAGPVFAVDGVSFDVGRREVLGIVGESGSGKSVTALSLLRLLPEPPARIAGGVALFEGEDLMQLPPGRLRRIRGNRIAMIFQDPMTSLNPLLTIGAHVTEPLQVHLGLGAEAARRRAVELLDQVRIPSAARRLDDYPHQASGGMRQRVMIAAALACNPKLLIADEPTTALDVTIQAQILAILAELRREHDMSVILITHDLGVIAETADRVLVMYAGKIVEEAPVMSLFASPRHPYTEALLRSIPRADRDLDRLEAIGGMVPPLNALPSGCRFNPRCLYAEEPCRAVSPALIEAGTAHRAACLRLTGYRVP